MIAYKIALLERIVLRIEDNAYIPCALGNSDYEEFRVQINADEATLEGVDGKLMTPEEAKAYVATLPGNEGV